jgi:parallel beta-helix repeat protein
MKHHSVSQHQLSGNGMLDSGIWIESDSIANYTHEIDESNTVNGKPVYYWKDVTGGRVPDDADQVIFVNCTNITIEDQNVINASVSIAVAFSSDLAIRNNICSYNRIGIIFVYSTA